MATKAEERGMSFQDERRPLVVHYDIELDDAGLDPYQFRAYQRIARRCAGLQSGECFESLQAMADSCKMSRPTFIRAIKTLLQRNMIRRISRQGSTSFYALTDKQNWLSFEQWERVYQSQPGKPQSQVKSEPGKPQSQGVVNERTRGWIRHLPGGGSVVYTKKTHEENTEETVTAAAIFQRISGRQVSILENELLNSEIQPANLEIWASFLRTWFASYPNTKSLGKLLPAFKDQLAQSQAHTRINGLSYNPKTHYPDGREKVGEMRNFVC